MNWIESPFGRIYLSNQCPPDRLYAINLRHKPDGALDMQATAEASAVVVNIGPSEKGVTK